VNKKSSFTFINVISVLVPLLVAILLGIRTKVDLGAWTKYLPYLNAVINTLTAILLLTGLSYIKKGKIEHHKRALSAAFCLGGVFLVFYVLYHLTNASTPFGGEGFIKYFYYFILISHILCSFVVLPLVLRAYYFGLNRIDEQHKKIVKFAFPIWLYVSVTGVIAFLMISPYYK
jgi:putative membrane protein